MANHIRICKVQDNRIKFILIQLCQQCLRNLFGAHFRLQIIGCNLRRRNQNTLLISIRSFHTTVEEEGYMRIFFGFRNAQLVQSMLCQHLTQGILNLLRRKGYRCGNCCIILRHAHIIYRACALGTCKIREVLIMQRTGNFTRSVRTEVEENHTVTGSDFAIYTVNSKGLNKLIRYACGIGCLYAGSSACSLAALAQHQRFIGTLHALPALVTVHCVIASADGSNLAYANLRHALFQLMDIFQCCFRTDITSVQKGMHINLSQAFNLRHADKC